MQLINMLARFFKGKKNIKITPYGSLLVFKKGYTPEFVKTTISNHKLNGLRISVTFDDELLGNLDFLREYDFLEALSISSKEDYDYGFLSSLKNLKTLSFNVFGKNKIDLSALAKLEKLVLEWDNNIISGLEGCSNIKELCLIDFKEKDFSKISHLYQLKELKIKTASIKSTEGLERLTQLEKLSFGNCRYIKSIKEVNYLTQLTSLEIDACTKIEDYDRLINLINLNKLELTNVKGLPSIKFITNFHSLDKLMLLGNTEVLDGDMKPAQVVKQVAYKHRKYYNVKIENKEHDELAKRNLEKLKASIEQCKATGINR